MTKKALLIMIVIMAVAYVPIRLFISTEELELVGSYTLFLTLLAILWYSWETSQLRIQQKDIMELSLKPHLIFIFRRGDFYLYNIGNGPAVNIRIDDAIVSLPDFPNVRLRFTYSMIIKKDEYLPIKIKILTEDGKHEASGFHLGFLMFPTATETVDVYVHFENLIGKKYEYKIKIGKDMPTNIEPIDRLLYFLMVTPKSIASSNYLAVLYEDPIERMRLLQYCRDKGFIEATPIETEEQGIVEFRNIRIASKGIDYIKGNN
jgi:hypothetical protein